jgi:hypothetical protein
MTAVIAVWRMVSTVLLSLEVPLEDGVTSRPQDDATPP